MKKILLLLSFFFASSAFAQNLAAQGTYYKDAQGNLYRLEVVPQQSQQVTVPQATLPQSNESSTIDSIPIYQNLIEENSTNGRRIHRLGQGFFWSSIPTALIGLAFFADSDEMGYLARKRERAAGAIFMASGITLFVTGIVVKSNGAQKIRQAREYKKSLDFYVLRKKIQNNMSVLPGYNVKEKEASVNINFKF